MSAAVGIWSLELTPGKPEIVEPPVDIRITNVSFGEILKDDSGRAVVKFTYIPVTASDSDDDDEVSYPAETSATTVLAALKPGTFEQATLDFVILSDSEYIFEVVGKNSVFLTGNYIDQGDNMPPHDHSDDEDSELDSDEEDAYDLKEVSSDVEVDPDEVLSDASRFEEVAEKVKKSLKRPAEDEAPSKAEKKKKGKDGNAVAATTEEKKEEKKTEKPSEGKAKKQKVEKEVAGVKVLDAKVGTGPQAKKGNTVSMRYIGKLTNGKIFDQNTKGKPFSFNLGKGEVIRGWDEGIVGMQVGGERKLTIPAPMAYGKKGNDGIPPNSALVFDVKLLEIK